MQIQEILDDLNHKTISSVEEASESIQSLIMSFPIPEEIEKEIYLSYDVENLEYVAVRSSATAEDGAEHAWAWQLDSFLNVTRGTLIEKVRRCWASLFTPRAIFYRFEKDLNKDHISVAVVIQKMIQSEMSGIAFSVHPVTENRNQMIIEAWYGLWEAIVSWTVTPDNYIVHKDTRAIDINVNHQSKALYRSDIWWNEWIQLWDKGKDQILTKDQIQELSKIILKIENHYCFPCDIERSYEWGEFYIVQSRPITTLGGPDNIIENLNFNHNQLPAQKFIEELSGAKSIPPLNNYSLFVLWSGYNTKKYYKNVFKKQPTYTLLNIRHNGHTQTFLSQYAWEEYASEVFSEYLQNTDYVQYIEDMFYKNFPTIDDLYKSYTYDRISKEEELSLLSVVENTFDLFWTTNAWSHFSIYFDIDLCYLVAKSVYPNITKKSIESIWHNATDMIAESFDKAQKRDILNYIIANGNNEKLIEHCQYFYTSYKNVRSLEIVKRELRKMYGEYLENPSLARDALKVMDNQLANKKSLFEAWKNNLSDIDQKIANFCQVVMRVRDERKNHFAKGITIAWRIAEKLFDIADIKNKNLIENILPFEELLKWSDYITSIKDELEKREKEYIVYVPYSWPKEISYNFVDKNHKLVNNYFLSDNKENNKEIKWQIGNKWHTQWIIRVIRSQDHFDLFKEDEILVTGMTRPEYVALMKKSKAIITDEWWITCHAAIVSRELNKPCIIGTKFATQILKDGDLVEIDADNGVVRILS